MIKLIENRNLTRPVFDSVFLSKDPFGYPFGDSIEQWMVFFDTDGYNLDKVQFNAICKGLKKINENSFFRMITEDLDEEYEMIIQPFEFQNVDTLYAEYLMMLVAGLENAMVSTKGTWGCLISQEMHAIVGGSSKFIQSIKDNYPSWKEDYKRLIDFWKDDPNGEWIKELQNRWPCD